MRTLNNYDFIYIRPGFSNIRTSDNPENQLGSLKVQHFMKELSPNETLTSSEIFT